jgi:hypothetical protein
MLVFILAAALVIVVLGVVVAGAALWVGSHR